MRPIRRFGTTTSIISDRLSMKNHENKFSSTLNNRSSWTSISADDDRRKLSRLIATNHYTDSEKENKRFDETNGIGGKPEIIISTPSFQLVCDRRRAQPRHSSADEATTTTTPSLSPPSPTPSNEKLPKGVLKKSGQNGIVSSAGSTSSHRSRWTSFARRTVSFADDKGLKLADIRLIDLGDPEDRRGYSSSSTCNLPFPSLNRQQASGFIADFILPPAYRRLRALQQSDTTSPPVASSQIVLESYASSRWSVTGVIAVRCNAGAIGEKRVFVRYSNDQWSTSSDNDGSKIPLEAGPIDTSIDRYSFTLPFPLRPQPGSKLEFKFGVRMPAGVGGVLSPITYWDDNKGSNYSFTFV